jgi:hypothetical protein
VIHCFSRISAGLLLSLLVEVAQAVSKGLWSSTRDGLHAFGLGKRGLPDSWPRMRWDRQVKPSGQKG